VCVLREFCELSSGHHGHYRPQIDCQFERKDITALIEACGFGMQLTWFIAHYRHPNAGTNLAEDIILGLIFPVLAVQNSIFLIQQMRDLRVAAKK
jgi:hypothetical protein